MPKWFRFLHRKSPPVASIGRARPPVQLHPDGVPVGLRPGDPIPPENFDAIWNFVQTAGRSISNPDPNEPTAILLPPLEISFDPIEDDPA